MTGRLVLENLKHKPMRSLLSFLLIGVPVTLILTLVGLSHGMLEDSQNRARGIGADVIIRGSSASSLTSSSGASIPEGVVRKVEEQPHVKMAMGVVVHLVDFPLNIMGVDLNRFNAMNGGFTFADGGPFQQLNDIIVDEAYARQKKKHQGETLKLMNRDWRIAGIVRGGKLARIVVQKDVLQELDAAKGKVSVIYVKLDNPALADEVAQELKTLMPNYVVDTMEAYTAMFNVNNIQGVKEFIYVIMGIGVVIGFAVVCLSMYMAVLQRTREIGILKALGASSSFILRIVLAEALILGIGGTVLGIIMSYGSYWAIRTFVPASIPMIIVKSWWLNAGLITLAGAGLGALYPGLSAARQDPIEALAYE